MTKDTSINNDKQSERKSHQEQTQEGKKKEEISPNTPKANQNSQRVPLQGNQPGKEAPEVKSNIDMKDKVEKISGKSSDKRSMH